MTFAGYESTKKNNSNIKIIFLNKKRRILNIDYIALIYNCLQRFKNLNCFKLVKTLLNIHMYDFCVKKLQNHTNTKRHNCNT